MINLILLTTVFNDELNKKRKNSQKYIQQVTGYLKDNDYNYDRQYIKLLRIGNAIYIEDIEKGVKYTREAYKHSSNYPFEYELSRINYSYSLIYLGNYNEAINILKEKPKFDLKLINKDTELSYINNYIVAQILSKKITTFKAVKKIEALLKTVGSNTSSDSTIIYNNLGAAYIDVDKEKALQMLEQIQNNGDLYHEFYAIHNILYIYFVNGDSEQFYQLYNKIKFPYMLKAYSKFFDDKFKIMMSLIDLKLSEHALQNKLYELINELYSKQTYKHFKNPILYGGIERWFE